MTARARAALAGGALLVLALLAGTCDDPPAPGEPRCTVSASGMVECDQGPPVTANPGQ